MSKPCTYSSAGYCLNGPSCATKHISSNAPITTTAFEFFTLYECNRDKWQKWQDDKGFQRVVVRSRKGAAVAHDTKEKKSDQQQQQALADDDYDMGEFDLAEAPPQIHSPVSQDNDVPRLSPKKQDDGVTLDAERDRIKKGIEERKRKRDVDMIERQKREQEELERVRKARERIREQMKEEQMREEQRAREQREEQRRLQQERELLNRMKELEPQMIGVAPVQHDEGSESSSAALNLQDPTLIKQYDSFLANKWRGKINFKKPRIPFMTPSGNENAVTREFRQQILDKFILTYSIRFEYKKKAILYAFESEDRIYRRKADQKRAYWLTGMNTLKSMGEFEEARKLETKKQESGVNVPGVKDEVSQLTGSPPPQTIPAAGTNSPSSSTFGQPVSPRSATSSQRGFAFEGAFVTKTSPVAATRKKQPVKQAPAAPVYCICGRDETYDSNMVRCDADDCEREWFHFKCVGLTKTPNGAWYCPKHEQENRESELEFI